MNSSALTDRSSYSDSHITLYDTFRAMLRKSSESLQQAQFLGGITSMPTEAENSGSSVSSSRPTTSSSITNKFLVGTDHGYSVSIPNSILEQIEERNAVRPRHLRPAIKVSSSKDDFVQLATTQKHEDGTPTHLPMYRNFASREHHGPEGYMPQPFLRTGLGSLPPEIRVMIWKYVLIAKTSDGIPVGRGFDITFSKTGGRIFNSLSSPLNDETQPPASRMALLRVCALVCQESQCIFYSENEFHAPTAPSLLSFVKCIGPERCEELRVLHLDGLKGRERMYSEAQLERKCREQKLDKCQREETAALTVQSLHPDAREAAKILKGVSGLRKIFLSFAIGEELFPIFFLLALHTRWNVVIDFVDLCRWTVRPALPGEYETWWNFKHFISRTRPSVSEWGHVRIGTRRRVEVDIVGDVLGNSWMSIERLAGY